MNIESIIPVILGLGFLLWMHLDEKHAARKKDAENRLREEKFKTEQELMDLKRRISSLEREKKSGELK